MTPTVDQQPDPFRGAGEPPALAWCGESIRSILRAPVPHQAHSALNRWLLRLSMVAVRRSVLSVEGLRHVAPDRDPFVLVLNHNQRREAMAVPLVLIYARGGKLIHFWSDWMFQLIPVVGLILQRSQVITVTTKPARPRVLNALRPLFRDPVPAFTRAIRRIESGASVGVFPEGTINRDPHRLLAGSPGAARLSLQTGAPLVPAGIRFPRHSGDGPIPDDSPMTLTLGPALSPPSPARPGRPSPAEVRGWHDTMMRELARLSGKSWDAPDARRTDDADQP